MTLTWTCDQCGQPIDNGAGYIEVSYMALRQHRSTPGHAELVAWRKWHVACDPEPEGGHYWVDVDRVRSFRDALHWTFHFEEKGWLACSNWREFVSEAAGVEL